MISLVRQRMLHPTIGYQMVRTLLTSQQIGMDKFLNNREVNVRANKGAYLVRSKCVQVIDRAQCLVLLLDR